MNTISWRRRLVAALLLPFLLVLAGCRMHADFDIKSAEDVTTQLDLAVPKSLVEMDYSSAGEMCEALRGEQPSIDDAVPEPYEEGDLWGCRVTGQADSSTYDDSFRVTEEDGNLRLVMNFGDEGISEADLALLGIEDIDFNATFTFPGDVVQSKGGTIDGNKVTYTSFTDFFSGVDITAEAGGGFGWVIIVLVVLVLGFLLLLALALGAFLFLRSRKKAKAPAAAPGGYGSAAAGSPAVPPAPGGQASPVVPPSAAGHGSPAVPPAPGYQGSPAAPQGPQGSTAVPPAPQGSQGSHQWNGSPAPEQPASGQEQPWSRPPQDPQPPQNGQQPQDPQQPPQNPSW